MRWGILGASKFAREQMGPAIHAARGTELVALASGSPQKVAPFRELVPGLRHWDSYEALLADPEIDAVYIPLPNHLHVDWSLRAIAAGKHVLCEKPLALNAGDFDRLIAARDASGLLLAEAFMITHHPQWHAARALISEGAIGRVEHADAFFSYDNRDGGNIRNRPETGGGSLRDIGVYTCGAIRFATSAEPLRLAARVRRENGVDTFAHVSGAMEGPQGGFSFAATTSMRLFPRQEVVFQGSQGMMRLTAPFNAGLYGEARVELLRGDARAEVFRFPAVNQYVLQVEAFGRAARAGAEYDCPLEFSRGTQAMIDRIFELATED